MTESCLHLFLGKGGVGKTTVSFAFASRTASAGQKTLFVQTDETSPAFLSTKAKASYSPKEVAPKLWFSRISGEEAFHEYAMRQLKFEKLYRAIFEHRPIQFFFEAAPGFSDLMILGKLVYELDRGNTTSGFNTIVFDCPATGHGLFLLGTPERMKVLTRFGPVYDRASHIANTLSDPSKTKIHLVTLPRVIVLGETLEMIADLKKKGLPVEDLWINRSITAALGATRKDLGHAFQVTPSRALQTLARRALRELREIDRMRKHVTLPIHLLKEAEGLDSPSSLQTWIESGVS